MTEIEGEIKNMATVASKALEACVRGAVAAFEAGDLEALRGHFDRGEAIAQAVLELVGTVGPEEDLHGA